MYFSGILILVTDASISSIHTTPGLNPSTTIYPTNDDSTSMVSTTVPDAGNLAATVTSLPGTTDSAVLVTDTNIVGMLSTGSILPSVDVKSTSHLTKPIDATINVDPMSSTEGVTIEVTPSLTVESQGGSTIDETFPQYTTEGASVPTTTPEGGTTATITRTDGASSQTTPDSTTVTILPPETTILQASTTSSLITEATHSSNISPDTSSAAPLTITSSTQDVIITSPSSSQAITESSIFVVQTTPDMNTLTAPSSSDLTSDVFFVSVTPTKTISNDVLSSIKPTSVLDLVSVSASTAHVDVGVTTTIAAISAILDSSTGISSTEILSSISGPSSSMSIVITASTAMVSSTFSETPPLQSQSLLVTDSVADQMDTSTLVIDTSTITLAPFSGPVEMTTAVESAASSMLTSSPVPTIVPTSIYNELDDNNATTVVPSPTVPSALQSVPPTSEYLPSTPLTPDQTTTELPVTTSVLSTAATETSDLTTPESTTVSEVTTLTDSYTTMKPQPIKYDLKVKLVLSGNCSVLNQMKNDDNLAEFNLKLAMALSERLALDVNNIKIEDTQCGSVIARVHFMNITTEMGIEGLLMNMSTESDLFTTTSANNTFGFTLLSSEILQETSLKPPTVQKPSSEKIELTNVQIIVIIVCSIVGGMLLIYAFGFCIYACYQKKKTKSFDLGETPVCNLHMEDFTLTKMQRPQAMYTEYGPVIHQRGVNGKTRKKNGHYEPIEDEMQCLAPEDIHQASTLPRRSSIEIALDTAIAPSNVNMETQGTVASGFDNPSFSSDDILDSGPDTDQELPYDPEQGQTVNNYGYQADDMAVSSNTNCHVRGEGATSF